MSFLLALLGAVFIGVSASDASALLAKHAQYAGWQLGDSSVPSWIANGTRTSSHATDLLTEKRSGIAYRQTLSVAGGSVNQDSGFTGSVVWESDPNGYTVKQLGSVAQIAYDINLIRSEGLASIAGSIGTGSAQVRGVNAAVIRIDPPAGLPMDVYEDPGSGAILQAIIDPQGTAKTAVSIDSYASVAPGKRAVSSWTVGNLHYSLSTIAVTNVADNDLRPPAPRASWSFGDASVPVTLFDLSVHRYQPRVTLSVNGVSGVFEVDTGTPSIIIFDTFARKAGVTALDAADFSAFSGNPRYEGYGLARSLTAGNSTLHNVLVERISAPDVRVAGLIGYDFFAGALAEVDFSRGSMQLYNPASIEPTVTSGAYAFLIDLTTRRPVIAMQLSGNAYGFPYFSTAEPFFMLLSQALRDSGAVAASDVSIESFNPKTGSRGFSGTMIESNPMTLTYSDYTGASGGGNCVLLHQAMIGPYKYESPPLCFVGQGVFGDKGGAIGNDFLRHFDWTIDYPDSKFILTPNSIQ